MCFIYEYPHTAHPIEEVEGMSIRPRALSEEAELTDVYRT